MKIFSENQLEKYAEVLLWGLTTARKGFKKYDRILLKADTCGLSLAEIVYKKLVKMKFNVITRIIETPKMERYFYEFSDLRQRKFVAAGEKELFSDLNGYVGVRAPESLTHLKDIDPLRQAETAVARKFLRDILDRNEEKGKFGWTLCMYPTEILAKTAKMSVAEYAGQIAKACFLNEKDPVKKWREIYRSSVEIKRWLKSLKIDWMYFHSRSMDLKVKIGEKRKFVGISGHNIPSFEIFTSPDCRYTEGVYFANMPSFRGGNYVGGVRIEFKKGIAVKVLAEKGGEYVKKILKTDRGASMVGEISLTDRRFSRIDRFMANTLFDENFGGKYGNCHLAVGNSYSDSFDGDTKKLSSRLKNKMGFNSSSIHWDLVNTENKIVRAKLKSGKTITVYEKGMFKY